MNWRHGQNRFGPVNDFAIFSLKDTEPTEPNLERLSSEVYDALKRLGHDPVDPCAVEGLHMAAFHAGDASILVGFSKDDSGKWSLHVQMIDPGMFAGTRDRRLAVLDRLNLDLHGALSACPKLKGIEWFQERKVNPGSGTARPMQ
jgi:hypothetical protein